MDYSTQYRILFDAAVEAGKKLGFPHAPLAASGDAIEQSLLMAVRDVLADFSDHLNRLIPGYWGNSCQALSTQIFGFLNAQGIPAEIVTGNVIINNTDVFSTTLESLKNEYLASEPLTGSQSLHAWISLGDDTIIDAALPPRLAKNHGYPADRADAILVGRAGLFSEKLFLQYEPIIVGSDFIAKTNPPDPMLITEQWRRVFGRR